MKPGVLSVDFEEDAAMAVSKPDAGCGGGMLRPSRICCVAVLSVAFWALVLYLRSATQGGGGGEASVLFNPSAFSLPFIPGITDGRRPPLERCAPPVLDGAVSSSSLAYSGVTDRCAGRYIYMYNLPPRFNADLVRDCSQLRPWMDMCPYVANCGMGQPLQGGVAFPGRRGWYATDQFMLDVIFHCRMKRYACLTSDPARAAAVFVPFYASLDGGRHLWNRTATRDALALDLVAWLALRPQWRAMGGRDHFLVAGRTTWDFRRETDADEEWGTKLLNIPAVRNMTALVLETSPWHQTTNLAVPYPTDFHPEAAADVAAWQEKARGAERRWLFSFVGAPRPGSGKTARAEIIRQCGASRRCVHFRCTKPSGSAPSSCESERGGVMRVLERSTFCLQPRGDTPTRRSTFDAVLAGCIPVFFDPDSAYTQYTRHLPTDPTKYSVLIMHSDITGGRNVSIEETLSKIPPETVKAMREEVIRLIPRVVYADPRSPRVDFEDAFDVALEAVIDRVAKRQRVADDPPVAG